MSSNVAATVERPESCALNSRALRLDVVSSESVAEDSAISGRAGRGKTTDNEHGESAKRERRANDEKHGPDEVHVRRP
jgi:hypothetical protein